MSGGGIPSSSLWAHPPLPPGKRVLQQPDHRSCSEDRKSTAFGFIRKFPSVRRNSRKEEIAADTCTYESFDSLFEDNDIVLVGTEYQDDCNGWSNTSCNITNQINRTDKPRPFASMFRSRSDGNLAARGSFSARGSILSRDFPAEPKGFTKYLRVLSGSWKNLLNSKWCQREYLLR